MSRYRYFSLFLIAVQVLGSPLPIWAISDTAFANLDSGFIWVMLAMLIVALAIPVLISWVTYRVLQRRQPYHEAPLLPILATSFLTYWVGNLIMSFVVDGVWGLLFSIGFIIGPTVLVWNITRKPLTE